MLLEKSVLCHLQAGHYDHEPLQYLRQAKFQNGRLMRWALALQPYRFLLRAIRGRGNVGADCLSRNPLEEGHDEVLSCE